MVKRADAHAVLKLKRESVESGGEGCAANRESDLCGNSRRGKDLKDDQRTEVVGLGIGHGGARPSITTACITSNFRPRSD